MTPEIPTLQLKCKCGNEWLIVIPLEPFRWDQLRCPQCIGHEIEVRWGGLFDPEAGEARRQVASSSGPG